MIKTSKQIASEVLYKLSNGNPLEELTRELDAYTQDRVNDTNYRQALKNVGMLGGGAVGIGLGGLAGAGLGSSIRGFPGYEATHQLPKALSKIINNPATVRLSKVLPFLGMGTGMIAGARKGYKLFDNRSDELKEDLKDIIDKYLENAV